MILAAIFTGVCLIALLVVSFVMEDRDPILYEFLGVLVGICCCIEIVICNSIVTGTKPTAMDVYQGKTTIEYTIRNNVKVDSVIVFKEDRNN